MINLNFIENMLKTVFVIHLVLLISTNGKPHKPNLSDIISSNKPKTTPNPMQTPDRTIFGKTSDNVGDTEIIGFSASKENGHRIIRSASADNGPNIDIACDYLPETVVLNRESIVEHRYATFHNDDEDVLTDLQFFETKTMK